MAAGIPRDLNGLHARIQELENTFQQGVDASKAAHRARVGELETECEAAVLATQIAYIGQRDPQDLGSVENEIATRVLESLELTNAALPLQSLIDGTPLEGEVCAPQYSEHRVLAFLERQIDYYFPQQVRFGSEDFYDRLETLWDRQMLPYERFPDFCITRQDEIADLQALGTEQNLLQQTAQQRALGVIHRDNSTGAPLSVSQTALHNAVQSQPVAAPGMVTTVDLNDLNMGVVPRFIRQFSNLETLSLNGNGLTWVPYLGNLERLTTLSLSDNFLTKMPMGGLLPESLTHLNLDRNRIVVHLPYEDRDDLTVTLADNPILCRHENDAPVFTEANLDSLPLTVGFFEEQKEFVGEITAASPLAHLYSTVLDSGVAALGAAVRMETQVLFNALPDAVKAHVYGQIWLLSGSPVGDPQFGQNHVFDNGQLFFGALHNAILALADSRLVPQQTAEFGNGALRKMISEAITRLPLAQQHELYGLIWQNAGSPMGEPNYGRNHILDSLAGFQAAFNAVYQSGTTEPAALEISGLIHNFGAQRTKQNVALMALALDRP